MDARRLEGFCLRDRAGHTVEDEPVRTVRRGDPFRDDADDDIVRNQLAGVHEALGLEASGCTVFNRFAKNIAGRDAGDIQLFADDLRLRTLTGAGST